MHIGQAALEAVVQEAQALVVESKQMKDRGVEIIDRADLLSGLVSELIRCAVAVGSLNAGAGQPGGEAEGVVVSPAGSFLEGGHSPELRAPDHQGFFEQAAVLEVAQEGRSRLVKNRSMLAVLIPQRFVAVPVADSFAAGLVGAIEALDEADSSAPSSFRMWAGSESRLLTSGTLSCILAASS